MEFGRLGSNIRQRLLCGFCSKKGTSIIPVAIPNYSIPQIGKLYGECEDEHRNGQWKAGPKQLPQNP